MQDKQSVLIVDDERHNLNLLADLLKPLCGVILAKNGTQALERAKKQQPDLILLDIIMPGMDGYQVVRELKNDELTREIPVIFISALRQTGDEEKGLLMGAVDYIAKPFHPSIVKARIGNHLKIVRQRKLLENIALLDGLTEIANRRSFDERFPQEWKRAARDGYPLSLAILDVDYFKRYNDNYGHAQGDEALRAIAGVMSQALNRPADYTARYGGEEFIALLPDTLAPGSIQLAEKIRREVQALNIAHVHATSARCITVSIGGATCLPSSTQSPQGLVGAADKMLYTAKNSGRNQVAWHPSGGIDG